VVKSVSPQGAAVLVAYQLSQWMGGSESKEGCERERLVEEVTPGDAAWDSVLRLVQQRSAKHVTRYGLSLRMTKLYRIRLNDTLRSYEEEAAELGPPTLLFHGTTPESVQSIIDSGFALPTQAGMFGKGVYFAKDPLKSSNFAKLSPPPKPSRGSLFSTIGEALWSMVTLGESSQKEPAVLPSPQILLCDVFLGKVMTVRSARPGFKSKDLKRNCFLKCIGAGDYDSIRAPGGPYGAVNVTEFVVYRPCQAIPRFIIEFERERPSRNLRRTMSSSPSPSAQPVFGDGTPASAVTGVSVNSLRRAKSAPAALAAGRQSSAGGLCKCGCGRPCKMAPRSGRVYSTCCRRCAVSEGMGGHDEDCVAG